MSKMKIRIGQTCFANIAIVIGETFDFNSEKQREVENYIEHELNIRIAFRADELIEQAGSVKDQNGEGIVYVIEVYHDGTTEVRARCVNSHYDFGVWAFGENNERLSD